MLLVYRVTRDLSNLAFVYIAKSARYMAGPDVINVLQPHFRLVNMALKRGRLWVVKSNAIIPDRHFPTVN